MTSSTEGSTTENHAYSDLTDCDTNNATRIGWPEWECYEYWPADYRPEQKWAYYRHLDRHNSGLQNGHKRQNKSYETYQINQNLVMSIGGRLKMGTWEKKRTTNLLVGLLRSNMGLKAEHVAFCTCAYVVHQYDDRRECHPHTESADFDPFFKEQMQELEITQERFDSVYGKVAYRIRNTNLETPRHDKYELNKNAPQTRHSTNPSDDGWL